MEILGLKITLLFVLSLTSFFFGLIPIRIAKFVTGNGNPNSSNIQSRAKRWMSFLSCFGGGVFLCTCLLDLLPDVRDKLSTVLDRLEIYTAYPVAEFVVACGFFIVLIVEQTALDCKEKSDNSSKELVRVTGANNAGDCEASAPLLFDNDENDVRYEGMSNAQGEYGSLQQECNSSLNSRTRANLQRSISNRSYRDPNAEEPDNHDLHSHSSLRSLLLLLALSLHSIFEGLAMGLQTDKDQLLAIFTAVIIHKNILAFSLGMNLVQSHLSKCSVVLSCLCFALMAPIGITLGIILIESFSDFTHSVMDGVLQGIATGTFLYITFFEVLPHEMNSSKDRLLKVLFLLLGFSTMAGLLFLDPTIIRPSCYRGAQPL
eukprot:XP_782100.1 PREDICTED: zinc transporter ZIP1-like [Strongylocentrotus purpuratus]